MHFEQSLRGGVFVFTFVDVQAVHTSRHAADPAPSARAVTARLRCMRSPAQVRAAWVRAEETLRSETMERGAGAGCSRDAMQTATADSAATCQEPSSSAADALTTSADSVEVGQAISLW